MACSHSPGFLVPAREAIQQELQAQLPLLLLLQNPLVKRGILAQPEAVEEGTTHQGEGVVPLGEQGRALRLSGKRGEQSGLFVGLLHHVQVQLERRLRV
jgi:hypothetical protein